MSVVLSVLAFLTPALGLQESYGDMPLQSYLCTIENPSISLHVEFSGRQEKSYIKVEPLPDSSWPKNKISFENGLVPHRGPNPRSDGVTQFYFTFKGSSLGKPVNLEIVLPNGGATAALTFMDGAVSRTARCWRTPNPVGAK